MVACFFELFCSVITLCRYGFTVLQFTLTVVIVLDINSCSHMNVLFR